MKLCQIPKGSDGGKEWIEIHNRWFTPIHLKDWSIQGSGSNESHTFDPDLEVGSDGYALLGQTSDELYKWWIHSRLCIWKYC